MGVSPLQSVGFLTALVLAIGLVSCSSGDGSGGTQNNAFENEAAGISLSLPNGWHATTRHFTVLLDPFERVTLASFPLDGIPQSGRCSPNPLLGEMPRIGVFASVLEYMDAAARRQADPRPSGFRLGGAAPGGFDCFAPPDERADAYAFNFSDNGRAFIVLLAVGRDATPETRNAVEHALDSLRVEPCDLPLPTSQDPVCRRPLPH
jgi:hypothetical protein